MALKRLVAKKPEDLQPIIDDVKNWFKSTKTYKSVFTTEKRKFQDPETKQIEEKEIEVMKLTDNSNGKEGTIKFIPMKEKNQMKIELSGEGETMLVGKIHNQLMGRGVIKSYTKDAKKPLNEEFLRMQKLAGVGMINENIENDDVIYDNLLITLEQDYESFISYMMDKAETNPNITLIDFLQEYNNPDEEDLNESLTDEEKDEFNELEATVRHKIDSESPINPKMKERYLYLKNKKNE